MCNYFLILVVLAVVLQKRDAARILAWFPAPSISHQVVFRPLTQELARRGHDVTVITTDPAFPNGQTPENLTEIDVHDISYDIWRRTFVAKQSEMTDDIAQQMQMIYEIATIVVEKQLESVEMKNILNGQKEFDLLLIEAVALPAYAIKHVIKAPLISISSLSAAINQMEAAGAPVHPFLYPDYMRKKIYDLTMWEKIQELYLVWRLTRVNDYLHEMMHSAMTKYFGKDLPPLQEFEKDVDLIILNENPVWTGIRPVPPGVVYIGGIHQKPKKDLPTDLKTYLDTTKHGVIYMSFGTNVDPSLLPPEKIQAFIKAFSELPYDVLWKWNEDDLPGRSENIKISKWLPQSDLLYHPKVKLFITQGGLQSMDEVISAGVPVIGVPFFGDQWYNAAHYVHHQVGLQLDIQTLDAEKVKNAVETVIGDPRYRENMLKMRDLIRDEPMTALERAVWWTEHVLRHGGARHLRAPAAFMPWAQYYELNLVLTLLGVLVLLLLVGIAIVSFIVKLLMRKFKGVKVKSS